MSHARRYLQLTLHFVIAPSQESPPLLYSRSIDVITAVTHQTPFTKRSVPIFTNQQLTSKSEYSNDGVGGGHKFAIPPPQLQLVVILHFLAYK